MGFQVYEKGSAPVSTTPSITIQRRGTMSLNRAAYELLEKPDGVELLWDGDRRAIALRPSALTNQNAYPVRSQSSHADKGPWMVAATLFTQFIGLDTTDAYRWTPTLENGLLVIDVSKPGSKATSNRTRAAERAVAGADASMTAPILPSVTATGFVAGEGVATP